MNDGEGIPVELHEAENIYVPELIFGHLLTSGNYEKKQKHTDIRSWNTIGKGHQHTPRNTAHPGDTTKLGRVLQHQN